MNRGTIILIATAALIVASHLGASDWPNFLGPNHNGIIEEGSLRTDWNSNPPEALWTSDVGMGCSAISIANGRAFTLGNQNGKDTVWCLDASTGKLLWKYEYSEELDPKYYSGGTSSTPTIDGERVYTVSKSGKLFCFDFESGNVNWSKDYTKDFNGRKSGWGWAASPRIHREALIIDPGARDGAIVALDKTTGAFLWKTGDSQPGYSYPVVFNHEGREALAVFHGKKLVGYDLESEDRQTLFSFLWRTTYGLNVTNPQYRDGKMFLSSGYGSGYAVIDIGKPEAEIVHRDRELPLQLQTNLLIDGRIHGIFGEDDSAKGELVSLDFDTGNVHWRLDMPGNTGHLIAIGEHLIVYPDSGHAIIGQADKSGFTEIGRIVALPGLAYAPPSFANGYLYLRNNQGNVVCLDVSAN